MGEFIAGIAVGLFIGTGAFIIIDPDTKWHKSILEHGHGEYNRTTGEFQFLPACNKEK